MSLGYFFSDGATPLELAGEIVPEFVRHHAAMASLEVGVTRRFALGVHARFGCVLESIEVEPTGSARRRPHDERDQVVDFVHKWHETTEVPIVKFVEWLGIARAKFYEWRRRYGKASDPV